MVLPEWRLELIMPAALAGLGTLLLCLVALDLAGAFIVRLWLRASLRAARQARFHAGMAAYRGRTRK